MKTQKLSQLIYAALFLLISFSGISQEASEKDSKKLQVSFVYPVGSNGHKSGQVSNDISFNMIAGYTGGVEAFELGGIYNIVNGNVTGTQISGFGNAVRGHVHGFQLAGFINSNKDFTQGIQIAGFTNLVADDVKGFQLAGFMNGNKGSVVGTQISGFLNMASADVDGFQLAGFSNFSSDIKGSQISGFVNKSGNLRGFQLAGFVNMAKEVKGVQLSVINLADSVISGTQIGLVNLSRNGFISAGLESDDVIPYGVTFRSGQEQFYTVLTLGLKEDEYWAVGAGFGSRLYLGQESSFFINPELRWQNINKDRIKGYQNNNLVRFNANLGYQFNNLYLTAGPTLNFYHTRKLNGEGQPVIDLANKTILDRQSSGNNFQLWMGYNVGMGIRF